MMGEVAISLIILTGLGLLFAAILALAYKKLRVQEDPRIDKVEAMLPGANCGACGAPGCRAFAEQVVGKESSPGKCTVSPPEGIEKIATFLGVDAGGGEKLVARLLCAGGAKESPNHREAYTGNLTTCRGMAQVSGGTKDCGWGCLGMADCAVACDFDAIRMNSDDLPVVDVDKCVACNDCVEICPKGLFVLMPISQKLIVQCRSLLEGDEALARCSVACNACGRCAADAPPNVIVMRDQIPVIDYALNELTSPVITSRCPTGAIVWLDDGRQFAPGRKSTLPVGRVDMNEYDEQTYYQ